jgi:hypothetical protein
VVSDPPGPAARHRPTPRLRDGRGWESGEVAVSGLAAPLDGLASMGFGWFIGVSVCRSHGGIAPRFGSSVTGVHPPHNPDSPRSIVEAERPTADRNPPTRTETGSDETSEIYH